MYSFRKIEYFATVLECLSTLDTKTNYAQNISEARISAAIRFIWEPTLEIYNEHIVKNSIDTSLQVYMDRLFAKISSGEISIQTMKRGGGFNHFGSLTYMEIIQKVAKEINDDSSQLTRLQKASLFYSIII
jgi:hypothetical protein